VTRYSAVTLDLSRFPPPLAIAGVDEEAILAARIGRLKGLLNELGVPYDVDRIEHDPVAALQQSDTVREAGVLSAVNDAVRAVMVAFATGADLDHLGLFYGIARRIIGQGGDGSAILEGDDEFRRQVLLAPEAFSTAGTHGGYVFWALRADGRVLNADVWSPAPREVTIAVQSRLDDGLASADLVEAVRAQLTRKDIKPLTDEVNVRSVTNHTYSVSLDAFVLPGPDALAVKSAIEAAIMREAAARRTPARDMPRSALIAAAQLAVVDRVALVSPMNDIARDYGEVPVLTGLDVRVQTYAG